MNNKQLGTSFEEQFVNMLGAKGFWAHFIEPNKSGAQPFDVIAIRDGVPYVFDCKTCIRDYINLRRLETNQELALQKVIHCGCTNAYIAVLHNDKVYLVKYKDIVKFGSVDLDESHLFEQIIH